MAFEKGLSGNPQGRPQGSRNKAGENIRNLISSFLEERFDQVEKDFEHLKPKDRIKAFVEMLPYAVPKLQAVTNSFDFEHLSDEQLDEIIRQLKGDHE